MSKLGGHHTTIVCPPKGAYGRYVERMQAYRVGGREKLEAIRAQDEHVRMLNEAARNSYAAQKSGLRKRADLAGSRGRHPTPPR